jgi:hypothetical protein
VAFTAIVLRTAPGEGGIRRSTLYVSQEYIPHKEKDESGAVLPNQEWQHPEPAELHYCEIGTLAGDERVTQLLESTLDLGIGQFGGHGRILNLDDCPWMNDRLETWADRQARTEEEEAEAERQRYAAEMARAPIYGYCARCGCETEQCKGPQHRAENRCMSCGGGLGDVRERYCINCLDLPFREKREQAIGERVVYLGEEPV